MSARLEHRDEAPPVSAINIAMAKVEVALYHGNKEEAYHAIDLAFAEREPEGPVTSDSPVAALGLPARVSTPLEDDGIRTVRDLCQCTRLDLEQRRNFGPTAIAQIGEALTRHGFSLRGSKLLELDKA